MTRHEMALEILHAGTVIPATPLALDESGSFDEQGARVIPDFGQNLGCFYRPGATKRGRSTSGGLGYNH